MTLLSSSPRPVHNALMSVRTGVERRGRGEHAANWVRHVVALRTLERVTSCFAEEGIPVLPVKGVLTAHTLYADASERNIGDVDVRIPRRFFGQVMRIAFARGWKPQTDAPALYTTFFKIDGHEVDVECCLGPPGLCTLSVEDLLLRAGRVVGPLGFPHLEPDLNDHVLILVLNAFKDGLLIAPWALEDLRRIVRHLRFDGDAVVGRAREGGVLSVLWLVADWLAEVHGVGEWAAVRDRARTFVPKQRVQRTYAFVRRRGWPSRLGFVVAAGASDTMTGCVRGFALTAAGVVRRRMVRTVRSLAGFAST